MLSNLHTWDFESPNREVATWLGSHICTQVWKQTDRTAASLPPLPIALPPGLDRTCPSSASRFCSIRHGVSHHVQKRMCLDLRQRETAVRIRSQHLDDQILRGVRDDVTALLVRFPETIVSFLLDTIKPPITCYGIPLCSCVDIRERSTSDRIEIQTYHGGTPTNMMKSRIPIDHMSRCSDVRSRWI